MNTPRLILIGTASLILAASANAQTAAPAGTPPAPPAAPAAAPVKPYSSADQRIYLSIAESMQLHLNMSLRLRHKYKEKAPDMVALGNKIHKGTTDLWTAGVDAAMAHGVEGKKIPQGFSKNDTAAMTKVNAIKDEKKWEIAFFEFFAKEAMKGAADAEKGAKAVQSPDLKPFAEKAAALLKSNAEQVEAKFKELKAK